MIDQKQEEGSIWLVGCGNMAGAMLRRWLDIGLAPETFTVIRPSGIAPAEGVRTLMAPPRNGQPPRVLILGVKPQMLNDVAAEVAAVTGPDTLIVSILAGTELAALQARFPAAGSVVRAIPNTPVAIGRGVVVLAGDAGARREELEALMAPLGLALWIGNEDLMHAAAAVAGSGPAFVFRFIAALAAGGEALGLSEGDATRLALATVAGAAGLAQQAEEGSAALAERVASPGGMTRRGLDVLDNDSALDALIAATLAAAERRSREMAAEAR